MGSGKLSKTMDFPERGNMVWRDLLDGGRGRGSNVTEHDRAKKYSAFIFISYKVECVCSTVVLLEDGIGFHNLSV